MTDPNNDIADRSARVSDPAVVSRSARVSDPAVVRPKVSSLESLGDRTSLGGETFGLRCAGSETRAQLEPRKQWK